MRAGSFISSVGALALVAAAAVVVPSIAQEGIAIPAPALDAPARQADTEVAVLAGGCFWGVQELFRRYDGVLSTRVGYTGGNTPNATYRNHGTHAEAVEIVFDPARISYRQILEFFFQNLEPQVGKRVA